MVRRTVGPNSGWLKFAGFLKLTQSDSGNPEVKRQQDPRRARACVKILYVEGIQILPGRASV